MSDHAPTDPAKRRRQARLEETLKENLRRRKAQSRARSTGGWAEGEQGEDGDRDDGAANPSKP